MSRANTATDAVAFLREIAGELAEIHSGSDYSLWRGEAKNRVDQPSLPMPHCRQPIGQGFSSQEKSGYSGKS